MPLSYFQSRSIKSGNFHNNAAPSYLSLFCGNGACEKQAQLQSWFLRLIYS